MEKLGWALVVFAISVLFAACGDDAAHPKDTEGPDDARDGDTVITTSCASNNDCAQRTDTPVCDLAASVCVQCLEAAQCAAPTPACDATARVCVQCTASADCATGFVCDGSTLRCVQDGCLSDLDCPAPTPACELATAVCVACTDDVHCGFGESCEGATNTCVQAPCVDDTDCLQPTPACDSPNGLCVACVGPEHCGQDQACDAETFTCYTIGCSNDADCAWPRPVCDESASACVACLDDGDCPGDATCDASAQRCAARSCTTGDECLADRFLHVCDVAAGHCAECVSTTDCVDNLTTTVCEVSSRTCVECQGDIDCATNPLGAFCDRSTGLCGECVDDANCVSGHCNRSLGLCVECLDDTPCGSESCREDFVCGTCASSFECTSASAPACVDDACVTTTQCAGDDANESADDGPAGAVQLTPSAGDTRTVQASVCAAGEESDWYTFTVADGDHVNLTLSWLDAAVDLDLTVVSDGGSDSMGMSWFSQPEDVRLTYLPAGTYFAIVTEFNDVGVTPNSAAVAYELTLTLERGNACASAADCAAAFASQVFRGACVSTGACTSLKGNHQLPVGSRCDSVDDCASGLCTYGLIDTDNATFYHEANFIAGADTRGYCVARACADDAGCGSGEVCSTFGLCLPACTASSQCPVSLNSSLTIEGWPRMLCDTSTGRCSDG